MSYCRWSSDDFRSDVYVYEDVSGGWTTHVAGRRHTLGPDDFPPEVDLPLEPTDEELRRWLARRSKVMGILNDTEYVDIHLPHAGECFNDPTPAACADRLESLRAIGYTVPQYAIDRLRQEAA